MAHRRSLTLRETVLVTLAVVLAFTLALGVRNPRKFLMLFPAGQQLARMDTLLDLDTALLLYKIDSYGKPLNILSPMTPLPVILNVIRPYITPLSSLRALTLTEYQNLVNSIDTRGVGIEYRFVRYKTAVFDSMAPCK